MLHLHEHLADKSHVIWDWNGTLLDDIDLCVASMAAMLEAHGIPRLTVEEHRRLFRMPVRDFYRDLGFDLERVPFERLAHDFVERYTRGVRACRLFEGTVELLHRLQSAGKRQAVLSAAREADLLALLREFDIRDYFDHVCGLNDIYATTKVERGRELLWVWDVSPTEVILVGDMDHDVEVARALGVDVLVLADGHQHEERLKQVHPTVILRRRHTAERTTTASLTMPAGEVV